MVVELFALAPESFGSPISLFAGLMNALGVSLLSVNRSGNLVPATVMEVITHAPLLNRKLVKD